MIDQIQLILDSSQQELRFVPYVESLIKEFGLYRDERNIYGEPYNSWQLSKKEDGGLWQQPRQLAEALVWLSYKNIKSYFDIGTFNGYTFTFINAYLSCFDLKVAVGIDPIAWFNQYKNIKSVIRHTYYHVTDSSRYKDVVVIGDRYDITFIDGVHENDGPKIDYENIGKHSKYCMFHDINDQYVPEVGEYWRSLPGVKIEFTYHPENKKVMGIGIIENGT
jgi:hypothetical protein